MLLAVGLKRKMAAELEGRLLGAESSRPIYRGPLGPYGSLVATLSTMVSLRKL